MALFKIGKSFNIFENKDCIAYYYKINLIQKLSLAKLFKRVLLDEIYKKIKIDVYTAIDTYIYLNYITNGFLNISYKKIINLSIYIQIKVF